MCLNKLLSKKISNKNLGFVLFVFLKNISILKNKENDENKFGFFVFFYSKKYNTKTLFFKRKN